MKLTIHHCFYFINFVFLFHYSIYCYCDSVNNKDYADNLFKKGENLYNSGKYDSAVILFKSAAKIYYQQVKWEKYIKSLIETAHCYRRKGDFKTGLDFANIAENAANQYFAKQNIIYSDIYHLKGTLLASSGDYTGSIPYYEEAIKLKIQFNGEKDTNLSNTYNNLGNTYFHLGDYNKALIFYKKAIKNASCRIVPDCPDMAMLNLSLAITYSIKGDFDNARFHYLESLRIGRKVYREDDEDYSRILMNIGTFYNQLGYFENALAALNAAKMVFQNKFGNNYYELGYIYTNIGKIYSDIGDIEKALNFFYKALQIYKSNYNANHPEIASTYMNIGRCFYEKKEYTKAISYYNLSINTGNTANTISKIRTYRNTGKAYEKLNEFSKAEYFFDKAINISIQLLGTNHYETAKSYLDKAEFYYNSNRGKEAIKLYFKSLDIFKIVFGKKHQDISYCLANIGDYYFFYEKDYLKAIKYYQLSLIAINTNFNDTDIYKNPDMNYALIYQNAIRPLRQKAAAFVKYWEKTKNNKDIETALETYLEAVKVLDKIRTSYSESSSFALNEKTNNIYHEAIETSIKLYEISNHRKYKEIAFQLSEKNKATILLSAIREIQAKNWGRIPKSFSVYENQLEKEIVLYKKLLYNEELSSKPDEEKISLWRSKLLALTQQKDALEEFLNKNYHAYFNLKYNTDVINIYELQKKLDDQQTLIEYSLLDSTMFIFLVTKQSYEIKKINVDSNFYNCLNYIIKTTSNNNFADFGAQSFNKFVYSSHILYNFLISPIAKNIQGEHLTIIPSASLSYLPFEILLAKPPDSKSFEFRNLEYLITKYCVSYSFSSTLLFTDLPEQKNNKKLLAFAPEYNYTNSEDGSVYYIYNEDSTKIFLKPLPGAIKEVNEIKKYYNADIFEKKYATESNFKKYARDYDIIHLAMHTIIDDRNPAYSKLIFEKTDNEKEDGLLNTYEIFNMELKSRMVVLSSCNSGYGKLQTGEGIMSLARGFIYAGCPALLMTLWTVEDQSGSDIMISFYKNLNSGMSKDQALRYAKLTYLKNCDQLHSHPYFWAGYVNIGSTVSLNDKHWFNNVLKDHSILILILFNIILIIILILPRKVIFILDYFFNKIN